MKSVVLSLAMSIVMIIGILYSHKYLNNVSQELGNLNDEIEQYITDSDWDKAYESAMEYTEKWKEYSKVIKIFLDHQEMDNIEIELWKLPQYIKEETKDEALASIHILKFLVDHISELEQVTIENIF